MVKQAIIPLAGMGTRLLPLTSVIPKELLPINGKPGLEYILDECIDAGIKEIIFIISNKKKIIKKYFYNYHIPSICHQVFWIYQKEYFQYFQFIFLLLLLIKLLHHL